MAKVADEGVPCGVFVETAEEEDPDCNTSTTELESPFDT